MKALNLFIVFFLLFSLPNIMLSQNTEIDSLKLVLQSHKKKDTTHVNLLFDLGHLYHRTKPDKAMVYFEESEALADSLNYTLGVASSQYFKGITLAIKTGSKEGVNYIEQSIVNYKKINNNHGLARSYEALGIFSGYNSEFKKAIEYRLKALKIKEEIGDKKGVLNNMFYIAALYKNLGDYTDAFTYYKKTIKLGKEMNNESMVAECYSDMGNIYAHQGNFPLSLENHNKSMDIGREIGDNKVMCDALISIGNVNFEKENYDEAIVFYEKALKVSERENYKEDITKILSNLGAAYSKKKDNSKAIQYFNKVLKKIKEENNKLHVSIVLHNLGMVYSKEKDYNLAYKYLKEAQEISLNIGYKRGLMDSYLGISEVYFNQKKYAKALINAQKGKSLSEQFSSLGDLKRAEDLLYKIYEKIGDYKKAFQSHQQFKTLNDSLFNKENIEKIAQLEAEYKYRQALDSASIKELQLTKTITATNINLEKSQRNYLWAIIGVLIISMLLGSVIFYQKLKNAETKAQNAVIEQKLLRSQMTPHFIFNSLSVLQGMVLNKEYEKSVNYLSKFSKLLRITLENSRDKMVSLSKELTAIQNYLALQNLENNAFQSTVLVEDSIDVSLFEIPPMLIQPFVENAIEHAFEDQETSREIDIKLTYTDKKLICFITDNGIGCESQKMDKKSHKKSLSSSITSERLKMLSKDFKMKGSITVEDRQKFNEQGTIVTIVIPYKILVT